MSFLISFPAGKTHRSGAAGEPGQGGGSILLFLSRLLYEHLRLVETNNQIWRCLFLKPLILMQTHYVIESQNPPLPISSPFVGDKRAGGISSQKPATPKGPLHLEVQPWRCSLFLWPHRCVFVCSCGWAGFSSTRQSSICWPFWWSIASTCLTNGFAD